MRTTKNIAARAGRWSAQPRKKAIFGWLAFVILAFAIGNAIGTKPPGQFADLADRRVRPRGRRAALDVQAQLRRAGARPGPHGSPLPRRLAVASATSSTASGATGRGRRNIRSPLAPATPASSPRAAFRARDRSRSRARPSDEQIHEDRQGRPAAAPPRPRRVGPSGAAHRAVRRRERPRRPSRSRSRDDLQKAETAVASDHARDPGARVRRAGRRGRADRSSALTAVMATIGLVAIPSHFAPRSTRDRRR